LQKTLINVHPDNPRAYAFKGDIFGMISAGKDEAL